MKINSTNNISNNKLSFTSKISTREQAGNELIKKGEIDKAIKTHGVEQKQMSEILPYVKTQVLYNSFKNEDSIMQFPQALSELAIRFCDKDDLESAVIIYQKIPQTSSFKALDNGYNREDVAKTIVSKAAQIEDEKRGSEILSYFI